MKDLLKGVVYTGIFAVPFIVLLVTSSMFFPYITGKNFAFRIIVEIVVAAWFVLALYEPRYRPKFSWIAASGLGFLAVMLVANLFGEYAPKSFWSNYERMDGYVTLVHFYLYFLVIGTMFTLEKHWRWFFNTTLGVAVVVCFFAFAQLSGAAEISQGGSWRVDSTLGNSTYMAVYMLFHIFIAALLLVRTPSRGMQYLYLGFIALFVFFLLQTGTRGATLGILGGGLLTALYVALFAEGYPRMRKIATGGLIALALLVGGFIAVRDTSFVESSPMLNRLASISLESGTVRFMVWSTALEGIKERPILGWGQENFSYVFNKYYDPGLYYAEPWYDRVHNIALDWLIAGGIVGAFFYFSIIGAALYYIFVQPLVQRWRGGRDETFTVAERGLLLGLLGAYVFHNLFVFDNIVSYIFFAVTLAFIHCRVAREIPAIQRPLFNGDVVRVVIAPLTALTLAVVVYVVNVPSMLAARDIITAFQTQDYDDRFAIFERAWKRSTFGDQEIAEQVVQQAMSLADNPEVAAPDKRDHLVLAEQIMRDMIEQKPGDARFHLFLAGLYKTQGRFDEAAEQLAYARELTPAKPTVIVEQGIIELQRRNYETMHAHFETAYTLAPSFARARVLYAGSLLRAGDGERVAEILAEEDLRQFADAAPVFVAIGGPEAFDVLNQYLVTYIETHPESTMARMAYAQILLQQGERERALTILDEGAELIPSFADTAACLTDNINAERPLYESCE